MLAVEKDGNVNPSRNDDDIGLRKPNDNEGIFPNYSCSILGDLGQYLHFVL
jgi:hypothetical protein